jgi:hypothetical protein
MLLWLKPNASGYVFKASEFVGYAGYASEMIKKGKAMQAEATPAA